MTSHSKPGSLTPGLCRWILRLASPLVPGPDRARWRSEWEAELWHASRDEPPASERGARRPVPRPGSLALLARCLGAIPHALWLRRQDWRPEMFVRDLRFALRSLARRPGFAAVAVLTLALGIGGNTAIFSLVNQVILKPLPYPDAGRLVMVWEHQLTRDRTHNVVNPGNFNDWREQSTVFAGMAAFVQTTANLTGSDDPEEIPLVYSSPELFSVLGVDAAYGRVFSAGRDDQESGVVVVSHGFWQRKTGGDPEFVGSTLTLNDRVLEVIGVLPPDVDVFSASAEMWHPYVIPTERSGRSLSVVARLRDGVTVEQATTEMRTIAGRLEEAYPDFNDGWSAHVQPLTEHVVGDVRSALLTLLAAVGFLLLIACANVANLLLGRAVGRRQELALRTSLGASRGRIARQLLTESAVLAGLGGLGGLAVATLGIRWLVAAIPGDVRVPRLGAVAVDGELLLFTLGIAAVTALLFGLVPVVDAARADLAPALRGGGRGGGDGRVTGGLRAGLIVAEVALSLMLLVGAGLMARSFSEMLAVDSGLRPENVVTAQVNLRGARYPEPSDRMAFFTELQSRMEDVPGVVAVGTNSFLPLTGVGSATSYYPEDRPVPPSGERPAANMRFVTGAYFEAMGIRLLGGRFVGDEDGPDRPKVAVVNQTLARAHWGDESPLGKRVSYGWGDDEGAEIVGVVADVLHEGVREGARAAIYIPWQQQRSFSFAAIAVRTAGDPAVTGRALRDAVAAIDPELPLTRLRSMEDVVGAAVAQPRLTTFLLGAFAVLALLLAAIGIYGVMSFNVSRRVNEMGIRMALGARGADVVGLVVRHGMKLALIGVALGILGAAFASRLLASLLFRIAPTDVVTYGGVAALLVGVALVACYLPARRATRVDPVTALRQE